MMMNESHFKKFLKLPFILNIAHIKYFIDIFEVTKK